MGDCNIAIADLETRLRVGIWDHEREFQPIRISLNFSVATCLPNERFRQRDAIFRWITVEWPTYPHTPLIETRLHELLQFIFALDVRIDHVDAAISKPTAFPEAGGVGVRLALCRTDYNDWFCAESIASAPPFIVRN